MNILLVEDNEIASNQMCFYLVTMLKCAVQCVATGKDAINYALREFDLILLDMGLPDIHGTEVARAIRDNELTYGSPRSIIISISNSDDLPVDDILKSGVNAVYKKPTTHGEMRKLLEGVKNL